MARTSRTRPEVKEVRRAAIAALRSRDAGSTLIKRMRAEQMKSKPKKARKLMKQFKGLVDFEDTLPIENIGRVKRVKKRNPFGGL